MKKIVVVNGYPRSGKTEFSSQCFSMKDSSIIFHMISSISPVIRAMGDSLNIDISEKDDKFRDFASHIKRGWDIYYDGSLNEIIDQWNSFLNRRYVDDEKCEHRVMFVDIREPHNIKKLIENKPENCDEIVTVFVERDDAKENVTASNDSDNGVERYPYNFYLDNNGDIEWLKVNIGTFIRTHIYK